MDSFNDTQPTLRTTSSTLGFDEDDLLDGFEGEVEYGQVEEEAIESVLRGNPDFAGNLAGGGW